MSWQPIETAPKDGREVLFVSFLEGYKALYEVGHYSPITHDKFESCGDGIYKKITATVAEFSNDNSHRMTHWHELPEPPK